MATPAIWMTIHDALRDDIGQGRYLAGDKLPTEAQLAARFGVNRHTVRRALAQLAEDGVVYSRRGAGVFVAHAPADYPIGARVRFHQNLAAAGRVPGKEILTIETRRASADDARVLHLSEGAPVHICEGVSTADGQPLALFLSTFCATRFENLPDLLGMERSITRALMASGVRDYTRASTRLTAVLANPSQAAHLRVAKGSALMLSTSVNVDEDGQPVEFGRTWFAADRVTLTIGGS